jgi:hypothetical protein
MGRLGESVGLPAIVSGQVVKHDVSDSTPPHSERKALYQIFSH